MNTKDIREHMEVVGSCGAHVGTVDHIDGNSIKLAKNDPKSDGQHHWIPLDWVSGVDQRVRLNKPCDEAVRDWRTSAAGMGA